MTWGLRTAMLPMIKVSYEEAINKKHCKMFICSSVNIYIIHGN